jgi:hypothetical protein
LLVEIYVDDLRLLYNWDMSDEMYVRVKVVVAAMKQPTEGQGPMSVERQPRLRRLFFEGERILASFLLETRNGAVPIL